jgi:ParB family transcriptional regulator, chromosome partitioning protein
MNEKRRLGRGLGALIPEAMEGGSETRDIPVDRIKQNPYQPRSHFDEVKLKELAESIREYGVVQAVIVSPAGENEYYLVAGERRYRAAIMAGLAKIPAVIKAFDQSAMLEIALIENLQREDLNAIEEAAAYRRLMDEFNLTQEELARRIGKSRSAIANTMRLLSLPQAVREALSRGDISAGQARPLLAIADEERQRQLAMQIINKGLSARDAEKMVSGIVREKKPLSAEAVQPPPDPLWAELQSSLQHRLGTKVKLNRTRNGGYIEIHFFSDDDLDRLVSFMLPDGFV